MNDSIAGAVAVAAQAPAPFRDQIVEVAGRAYTDGMSLAFTFATVLGLTTAVVVHRAWPRHADVDAETETEPAEQTART